MTYQTLLVDVADALATVTVNRPEKLNALSGAVVAELHDAARALRADAAVRGVIVTGAGPKAFVAGADIAELARLDVPGARAMALAGQAMTTAFAAMGKPVVAAVNGFALGGGCELALACHIRIASENAKFGQPEVKLGLIPGYGGTQRLARLVGKGRALHLLLTGETIDAQEAYRIGLVTKVVPAGVLLAEAAALLRTILANGPVAVALTTDAVERGLDLPLADGLRLEADLFALGAATEDMKEGTRAFLEKRPPNFTGK
jgi:enoyl-CoA hydratase